MGRIPGRRGLTGHDPPPPGLPEGWACTLLAVAAAGLAACGGDSGRPRPRRAPPAAGTAPARTCRPSRGRLHPPPPRRAAVTVALAADESSGLSFDKKTATAKSGKVTLTLTNPAGNGAPHAIAIEGRGRRQGRAAGRPWRYVDDHRQPQAGQVHVLLPGRGHRAAAWKDADGQLTAVSSTLALAPAPGTVRLDAPGGARPVPLEPATARRSRRSAVPRGAGAVRQPRRTPRTSCRRPTRGCWPAAPAAARRRPRLPAARAAQHVPQPRARRGRRPARL